MSYYLSYSFLFYGFCSWQNLPVSETQAGITTHAVRTEHSHTALSLLSTPNADVYINNVIVAKLVDIHYV